MPFDDDDDQFGELNADAARNQVIFEDFLEQLGVDPDEMLATFHTNVAKVRDLQPYRDFYHERYEPWQRGFDRASYQAFIQSRQQPTVQQGERIAPAPKTSPVEPPLLDLRGPDDAQWDWNDVDITELGEDA